MIARPTGNRSRLRSSAAVSWAISLPARRVRQRSLSGPRWPVSYWFRKLNLRTGLRGPNAARLVATRRSPMMLLVGFLVCGSAVIFLAHAFDAYQVDSAGPKPSTSLAPASLRGWRSGAMWHDFFLVALYRRQRSRRTVRLLFAFLTNHRQPDGLVILVFEEHREIDGPGGAQPDQADHPAPRAKVDSTKIRDL